MPPVSSNRRFDTKTTPSAPAPEKRPARASEPQIAGSPPANSADRETRCLMAGCELRASKGGKGPGTVVGYAAVFEKFSQDLGGFKEKIAPGAFSAVMTDDVRALKNHDSNYLLGRSKSGTLRMTEDQLGLRVEIDLPNTQVGRDTAEEIARCDIDGMSFSFTTDVDQWDYSGNQAIRTLIKIRELYDVGPVAYPAYTDTSVAIRSLEARKTGTPATAPTPVPSTDHFKFRLQVEQLRLLPITSE
jgi:uncharacterized protein